MLPMLCFFSASPEHTLLLAERGFAGVPEVLPEQATLRGLVATVWRQPVLPGDTHTHTHARTQSEMGGWGWGWGDLYAHS